MRCESLLAIGTCTPEELAAGAGITEFRWLRLAYMGDLPLGEEFRPLQLPALVRDLLNDGAGNYSIHL